MAYNIVVERDGEGHLPALVEDKISLERYATGDGDGEAANDSELNNGQRPLDWRFGKMQVSSLDSLAQDMEASGSRSLGAALKEAESGSDGGLRSGEVTPGGSKASPLKSVFMGYGVIRMFRDVTDPDESTLNTDDGTVLAILAVPTYMLPGDLVEFITPQTCRDIEHIRIVSSSGIPERYLALMKFRDSSSAQRFYLEYNGKEFSSMSPETCHVVYVKSVTIQSSRPSDKAVFPSCIGKQAAPAADATTASTGPSSSAVQFSDADVGPGSGSRMARRESFARARRSSSMWSDKRPLVELPTCPVCLERMDSNITGLLTILCQHTFHCHCLAKWGESSCPVCRYSQRKGDEAKPEYSGECAVCGARDNLWVCLICGHTGCGRYDNAHAWDHYERSGHCYAMDVATQRVWDYVGDNFVHRLIQNETDGKLVELPSASSAKGSKSAEDDDDSTVGLKYVYLMTSQLESQREYYESLCASASQSADHATRRAEAAERENAALRHELEQLRLQNETQVPKLASDLEKLRDKCSKLESLARKLREEYAEEKNISKRLLAKLDTLTDEKKASDATIADLNDQVRDLMFFLDAQNKLADAGDDVQQGTVVMGSKKGRRKR